MTLFDQRKMSASYVKTRIHFHVVLRRFTKKGTRHGDSTEPHEFAALMQITL